MYALVGSRVRKWILLLPECVLFNFFRSGALEFEVLSYIDYNLSDLWWFCLLCLIDSPLWVSGQSLDKKR